MMHKATEEDLMDGLTGRCDACGAEAHNVEPDARNYKCERCGALAVYGLEQLLSMGQVEIEGEE